MVLLWLIHASEFKPKTIIYHDNVDQFLITIEI